MTTINTKRMRVMIGLLGMLLPWLVALVTLSWPQSISFTYYSLYAVGIFMVILGSASILLINYRGYDKGDDITATIAGILGLMICFFPMTYLPEPSIKTGVLHLPKGEKMNLKEIRNQKGFTIPQLAEITGLSKRTIEDIQRRGDCLVSNAIKLADALGVKIK